MRRARLENACYREFPPVYATGGGQSSDWGCIKSQGTAWVEAQSRLSGTHTHDDGCRYEAAGEALTLLMADLFICSIRGNAV